jgi:hypothetical protein
MTDHRGCSTPCSTVAAVSPPPPAREDTGARAVGAPPHPVPSGGTTLSRKARAGNTQGHGVPGPLECGALAPLSGGNVPLAPPGSSGARARQSGSKLPYSKARSARSLAAAVNDRRNHRIVGSDGEDTAATAWDGGLFLCSGQFGHFAEEGIDLLAGWSLGVKAEKVLSSRGAHE